MDVPTTSKRVLQHYVSDVFYLRRYKNSIIEIGKAALISSTIYNETFLSGQIRNSRGSTKRNGLEQN